MRDVRFQTWKLAQTLRGIFNLGMARTFGRYIHSIGGPGQPMTAIYEWRGKRWHIALRPEGEL